MNKQNKLNQSTILALLCSAAALMATIFFVNPAPAPADLTIKDRDYQMVTATSATGSDALYVLDSRSGVLMVLMPEPGKGLQVKGSQPLTAAFAR